MRTLLSEFRIRQVRRKSFVLESLLFVAAYVLLVLLLPPEAPVRILVESLALQTSALAAALLILLSLPNIPETSRSAWRLMAMALMAWTVADLISYFYNLVPGSSDTFVMIVTGINLFAYLVMVYALLSYPSEGRYAPTRFRFILDALISSIAVVSLGWLLLARPLSDPAVSPLTRLVILSAPLADLVLLVILSNVSLTTVMSRVTTTILAVGLVSITVSDYAASMLAVMDAGGLSGFINLGWVCGTLLIGIGAVYDRSDPVVEGLGNPRIDTGMRTQFQKVLPVALVLVLFWNIFTEWRLRGTYALGIVWVSLILGVMLIVRLGIRAGEAELHKYWQLFKNLADPTFILDGRGNVILSNPAFGQMSDGQERLSSVLSVFSRLDEQDLDEITKTKEPVEVEVRTHKGSIPYLLTLSPLETDTGQILIAGVAHNLNDQIRQREMIQSAYDELRVLHNQLEELNTGLEMKVEERTATLQTALRQLEEQNKVLQALDQLKSDFVSMVSHELRTPLNNLGGGLELLLSRKKKTSAQESTLLLMQAEVRRLTRFVENILNVSAIEAGRLVLKPEPLSLKNVIRDVRLKWRLAEDEGRLEIHIKPDLPKVLAERLALESVLGHLLDNAIKYAPESKIQVTAQKVNRKVQIDIRDYGPGIPDEKQSLLFERFQRLDASDSQSVYGYGLGLYLSQKLLQAMGSELTFHSPDDGGACFSFRLKAAKR